MLNEPNQIVTIPFIKKKINCILGSSYKPLIFQLLRPPGGSVKLIFTKLTNLVSLEQSHYKPMNAMGICGGGPLIWQETATKHKEREISYLPSGL